MVALAGAAWCVLVAGGIREIYGYETTEGAAQEAPALWPTTSTLTHADAGFTLAMFIHPDCPCSRASLSELAAIAESTPRRPAISIVYIGGERGASWDAGGRVIDARRVLDHDGTEALRFGVVTSGHVVVYDAAGALRFSGGITGSRGHAGKNVGRDSVAAILSSTAGESRHAVFGCGLTGDGERLGERQ